MAVFMGTALAGFVAGGSEAEPLELSIRLVPGLNSKTVPGMWINGATGAVNIECTSDLAQSNAWALLANLQVTNNPYLYTDTSATNVPRRFYRASSENQSPLNPDPEHLEWIAPGTFTMGSPTNEMGRYSIEGPQTQVTLTMGFWMRKCVTLQQEYLAVTGTNPSLHEGSTNLPVERVTWYEATNFCGALTVSERAAGRLPTGYVYRLPTEAEWEYACRAGTATRFSFGDDVSYTQLGDYAWYSFNSGDTSHPVGLKQSNPWGLYDMHGNVWEWCLDWFGTYPGGSVTDPRGPARGSSRVFRGGSYYQEGANCRSATRDYYSPDTPFDDVGFRAVLAPGL
jgi:formylglycine-generating enzyme required for sulfatase activity